MNNRNNREYYSFKAGDIINVTDGSYSDYSIVASYKTLKDFNFITEYINTIDLNYEIDAFYIYLTTNGFLEEIEVKEIHEMPCFLDVAIKLKESYSAKLLTDDEIQIVHNHYKTIYPNNRRIPQWIY